MRQYTLGRDRIIDYIGMHHGFPVLHRESGEPCILRPDEPETDFRRVGWAEFFKAAEDRHYAFVFDTDPERFDWKWMDKNEALKLGVRRSHLWDHIVRTLHGEPAVAMRT